MEYLPRYFTFEELFGSLPDNFYDIVTQSYNALDYLHSKGYYHGDLGSPVNILWDYNNNRVVLIDLEGGLIEVQKDILNDIRDYNKILILRDESYYRLSI